MPLLADGAVHRTYATKKRPSAARPVAGARAGVEGVDGGQVRPVRHASAAHPVLRRLAVADDVGLAVAVVEGAALKRPRQDERVGEGATLKTPLTTPVASALASTEAAGPERNAAGAVGVAHHLAAPGAAQTPRLPVRATGQGPRARLAKPPVPLGPAVATRVGAALVAAGATGAVTRAPHVLHPAAVVTPVAGLLEEGEYPLQDRGLLRGRLPPRRGPVTGREGEAQGDVAVGVLVAAQDAPQAAPSAQAGPPRSLLDHRWI